ncbi:uncharacterized protein [Epargyreus clarus]|uniref:uncharacterized protein n=1 Tax=Epargyreus clarus TaxID=520877 RepID=UPI003C2E8497
MQMPSLENLSLAEKDHDKTTPQETRQEPLYKPVLRSKKLTCVGLAIELINKWRELDEEFPNFSKSSILVSCEQEVLMVEEYVAAEGPDNISRVDKEHVMVCVNVIIDGRPGVILADPGYHVPRIITVMMDEEDPHTGWFTQLDLPKCRKDFCYIFNEINSNYVEWHEKKTKGSKIHMETSLIYVARPYLEGINVTIRRNLVYETRSILARNENGYLIAGIVFEIRETDNEFTLFMDVGDKKWKSKYKFCLFENDAVLPEQVLAKLAEVNTVLRFEDGELLSTLRSVATVLTDHMFVTQMLAINKFILSYNRNEIPDVEYQEDENQEGGT